MDARIEQFIDEMVQRYKDDQMFFASYMMGKEGLTPIEMLMLLSFHERQGTNLKISKQVAIGNYRVDFVVEFLSQGEWFRAVIECDGHDFHEKTKEQAEHDKQRDRFLQGQGYRVLRFTGREIWRDPVKCRREVIEILMEDARKKRMGENLNGLD